MSLLRMTRAQYEREKLKLARQAELDRLARLRQANPEYGVKSAGFWLGRWKRERSPLLGTTRKERAA